MDHFKHLLELASSFFSAEFLGKLHQGINQIQFGNILLIINISIRKYTFIRLPRPWFCNITILLPWGFFNHLLLFQYQHS